jgi:hypothetical protein
MFGRISRYLFVIIIIIIIIFFFFGATEV